MDINYLRTRLSYDPDTGIFHWKFSPRHGFTGRKAGYKWTSKDSRTEYVHITIDRVEVKAHRAAWAIHYGEWPSVDVDHINGSGSDNRIKNLRLAQDSQNQSNVRIRLDNTSGVKGVSWHKRIKKWAATIQKTDGGILKRYHLGYFDCIEDAGYAVRAKREELHGEFANHG